MDELIPWFHQVLDSTEKKAEAAARRRNSERGAWARGHRSPTGGTDVWDLISYSTKPDRGFYRLAQGLDPELVDHIAFHDPERVLRTVGADRRILREYERLRLRDRLRVGPYWDGARDMCEMAVRARAEAYDDQPGYREVWRQCPTT